MLGMSAAAKATAGVNVSGMGLAPGTRISKRPT